MSETVHVWEKLEITLEAKGSYQNPYTDVEVWVDLKGPGGGPSAKASSRFDKRICGFWDGGGTFRVRLVATAPGEWSWTSGCNQRDSGLVGKTGELTAVDWTEAEKEENATRRGFVRPSANGHAFELADGTPFLLLGDTWWATPTFRHRWYDDDRPRPVGPEMGFKDMVAYRKRQGFNCIAILAGFPAWANDGKPSIITMDDERKTTIRSAWKKPGTSSAKDMQNEGGRPFHFPGRVKAYEDVVPDFDRINPEYFKYMDRKGGRTSP